MPLVKRDRKDFLLCLAVSSASAFFSFIYFILRSRGFFTILADFNAQQLTFTMALQNAVREAVNGWSWSNDLGISTIQGYSFYALGSPFFWVTLLFPSVPFPYLAGWIYMLKYITASVTAYFFLCRFTGSRRIAIVGAILYAFSGFQTTNLMYYHFHDAVAFFPLLLLGLEIHLADRKRKSFFILAVFINCLVNYYFFVQEVVFLLIYFLFRVRPCSGKTWVGQALSCLVCGLWGGLMAGVLFIPNILYILSNPRSSTNFYLSQFFWGGDYFLNTIKGFLLPGEAENDQAGVLLEIWNSADCYLPMVGIMPVLAYCAKKRNWLSRLLVFLLVISLSPLLSSVFLLFSDTLYRWWFMLTLVMALASCKVLEEPENYDLKKATASTAALLIGFFLLVRFVPWAEGEGPRIYYAFRFFLYFFIALAGVLITFLLCRLKKNRERNLILGVCVFAILTTGLTLHYYRASEKDPRGVATQILLGAQLETIDDQYRYRLISNYQTLPGGGSGMSVFSSARSAGSLEFDSLFDYYSNIYSLNKNEIPGLPELLGAKYSLTSASGTAAPVREYLSNGERFFVMENPACPIGYAVDGYILTEDLMTVPLEERGIALLSAAVIRPEDEARLSPIARRIDPNGLFSRDDIPRFVEQNTQRAVSAFARDGRGFICTTDYVGETPVYFSVPWDEGWTARIDGAKAEILDSGGMMLLVVPAGRHDVSFAYSAPGFDVGVVISFVSAGLFVGYVLAAELRKRKNRFIFKSGPENDRTGSTTCPESEKTL